MIYILAQAASPSPTTDTVSAALLVTPNAVQIGAFLSTLGLCAGVSFLLYIGLFYILRSLVRKWEKDTLLLILGISQTPLTIIFILTSLKFSLLHLNSAGVFIDWIQRGLTAFLIGAFTYWFTQLFNEAAVSSLKAYARKTEAVWDDVLIPLLQNFIPVITYIIGISLFFTTLGVDLTGIGLALGSITVVLGLAVKDILSNFFSGLVLLVDTPFKFGDVITTSDGSLAIIKQIGIRVTKLYLIEQHCELYMPNAALGNQSITNLSRPTTHYAYTIKVAVRIDADSVVATNILKEIVAGHPDTLANFDEKIKSLDSFYGLKEAEEDKLSKKDAGRKRISLEKEVNLQLKKIHTAFEELIAEIKLLEKGGLDTQELRSLQKNYIEVLNLVGMVILTERKGKRQRSWLEEEQVSIGKQNLISLVRFWYETWLQDPDLVAEDSTILPDEWEQKIEVLKIKLNKLFQKISNPGVDETRLDDYAAKLLDWLETNFKESSTAWKEPQIQITDIQGSSMQFSVRFYIDNIQLEHWRRGERVKNEVRREMIRRLRLAHIYTG
ncbi:MULTISPECIES: mechanosensitive ion channel family protein [unclassified Anabaena]|uniref:mechanosensitive ion channel family protein n=1 Tax=unclassified Anabaena TaxID=2619674 RepID=UPI001447A71C|nr:MULTISPECIES: mechanosensitive ion channel family protein [unclassified Anabaena]MTJ09085.1 mechanosensitive ion channel family protein [Anabaena sp. UHCC 0204]MTJ52191.1 mechanosensitive ion channel family protein [Anabaena sp. UHCC 0253]